MYNVELSIPYVYTPASKKRGYTVLALFVRPSVTPIFNIHFLLIFYDRLAEAAHQKPSGRVMVIYQFPCTFLIKRALDHTSLGILSTLHKVKKQTNFNMFHFGKLESKFTCRIYSPQWDDVCPSVNFLHSALRAHQAVKISASNLTFLVRLRFCMGT